MFQVGQQIECVDVTGVSVPCMSLGRFYRCLQMETDYVAVDCCAEHQNYCHWFPHCFRALSKRATDISFAHEILRAASPKVPA